MKISGSFDSSYILPSHFVVKVMIMKKNKRVKIARYIKNPG